MALRLGSLLTISFALLALPTTASAADETPSALDSDPAGWVDLAARAGTDFQHWSRGPIPPGPKLGPVGKSQWSVDPKTGVIRCDGTGPHEWIRYDTELADGILHVEWRFTPVTKGPKGYNSGIFARNSADGVIWHQGQTGSGGGGYLFGVTPVNGKNKLIQLNKERASLREKPAGEWNTYEIRFEGPVMTLWVNGGIVNTWKNLEALRGYVGLEAEGYDIEFRNVKLKTLKP